MRKYFYVSQIQLFLCFAPCPVRPMSDHLPHLHVPAAARLRDYTAAQEPPGGSEFVADETRNATGAFSFGALTGECEGVTALKVSNHQKCKSPKCFKILHIRAIIVVARIEYLIICYLLFLNLGD